jgi:hypothetical protein
MARPEVTGRKVSPTTDTKTEARATGPPIERAALTIREFCIAHRISEAFYYKIRPLGLGPRETRKLDKVTVSIEAAAEWRNPAEAETTKGDRT